MSGDAFHFNVRIPGGCLTAFTSSAAMALSAYAFYKFGTPWPGIITLILAQIPANRVSKTEAAAAIQSAGQALREYAGNKTPALPYEEPEEEKSK